MRLKSITLRNYRGVTESTVHFSDGVTVVEGPNEVGKSSIPEALRLLREAKASSRTALVRSVQPVHLDVGPEAEIELVTGPYDLTFRKRWLRDPLTELTVRSPRHEHFTGDRAHERYTAILTETVDSELLRAMEMIQGESMSLPDLAQVTSLHRALDVSGEQAATTTSWWSASRPSTAGTSRPRASAPASTATWPSRWSSWRTRWPGSAGTARKWTPSPSSTASWGTVWSNSTPNCRRPPPNCTGARRQTAHSPASARPWNGP